MKKLTIFIAIFLCSCADPMDTVIPQNLKSIGDNSDFSEKIKKIPTDKKELLGQYLATAIVKEALTGEKIPAGLTVREAIAKQDLANKESLSQKAKEDAEAQAIRAAENKKLSTIANALKVIFVKLDGPFKRDYMNYYSATYSIENTSGKEIKGFRVGIIFIDQFNNPIASTVIEDNQTWAANQKETVPYEYEYNQFNDDTKRLLSTPQNKLKTQIQILDVVF